MMNKLAILLLTATLSMASGAVFAADNNNGQANSSASAGQVAPGANENLAPKGVDNKDVNTGSTGSTLSGDGMTTDEVHKNTMCKDGRCPDTNKKVQTEAGKDVNTKTDGTSQ